MATNLFTSETLKRFVGWVALAVYAFTAGITMLLSIGYVLHPLFPHPWVGAAGLLLRVAPITIYLQLRRKPDGISHLLRGIALVFVVLFVSLSYCVLSMASDPDGSIKLSSFLSFYVSGTVEMWPCAVMILCLKSRVSGRAEDMIRAESE